MKQIVLQQRARIHKTILNIYSVIVIGAAMIAVTPLKGSVCGVARSSSVISVVTVSDTTVLPLTSLVAVNSDPPTPNSSFSSVPGTKLYSTPALNFLAFQWSLSTQTQTVHILNTIETIQLTQQSKNYKTNSKQQLMDQC